MDVSDIFYGFFSFKKESEAGTGVALSVKELIRGGGGGGGRRVARKVSVGQIVFWGGIPTEFSFYKHQCFNGPSFRFWCRPGAFPNELFLELCRMMTLTYPEHCSRDVARPESSAFLHSWGILVMNATEPICWVQYVVLT